MDYPFTICFWRVADRLRLGRRYVTRHRMTEAEAKVMDPTAEPAGGEMVITGPAVPHSTPAMFGTREPDR